jgi:hypothetical protein
MRRALIASAILLAAVSGTRAHADTGTAVAASLSQADRTLVAKSCKCSWSQRNNDPNSGLWVCTVPPGCPITPVRRPPRYSVYRLPLR